MLQIFFLAARLVRRPTALAKGDREIEERDGAGCL